MWIVNCYEVIERVWIFQIFAYEKTKKLLLTKGCVWGVGLIVLQSYHVSFVNVEINYEYGAIYYYNCKNLTELWYAF